MLYYSTYSSDLLGHRKARSRSDVGSLVGQVVPVEVRKSTEEVGR